MRYRDITRCVRSIDARRQEGQQAHHRTATEREGDTGAHHAPAQGHRPASSLVSGGDDPSDLVAGLDPRDATGDQVGDRLVDLGQVRIVDRRRVTRRTWIATGSSMLG